MASDASNQTIRDFGAQWTRYPVHDGYLASAALLADNLSPFVSLDDLKDRRVADIGSGTGRVVLQLLDVGVASVVAVEPSAAFEVLVRNTAERADRITYINGRGEALPPSGDLDYVISLGVLHHIPDPAPVIAAGRRALRGGGQIVIWLYAREGNRLYLALAETLRMATTRLPDRLLVALTWMLDPLLWLYAAAARRLPLPCHRYMREVIARLDARQRRLTIFDQLNPAYSHYYTRDEAIALVREGGFTDVKAHHRHGYSWLVTGRAPR